MINDTSGPPSGLPGLVFEQPSKLPETEGLQPSKIKNLLVNYLHEPLVLKGYLKTIYNTGKSWECVNWNKDDWIKLLDKELLEVRFGQRIGKGVVLSSPQWERSCLKGRMSYDKLLKWDNRNSVFRTLCGTEVTSDKYWAYFDYYYMKNLKNINLADNVISWKEFGFPELKAQNSTLWIGTSEANTPCHIDTYGCNIVCQIYGRKRWTLFPPDQSKYLYATRIPYEESSIYSSIAFPAPDMNQFPEAFSASPFIASLEAGDVLLVPKHWWHFVENLDFSISINSWISLPSDCHDRLKETFVMYNVGSLCQSITYPSFLKDVFNPGTLDVATMTSSDLLQLLVDIVLKMLSSDTKLYNANSACIENRDLNFVKDLQQYGLYSVSRFSFTDYLNLKNLNTNVDGSLRKTSPQVYKEFDAMKLIIETFTDDTVITVIKETLEKKISRKQSFS